MGAETHIEFSELLMEASIKKLNHLESVKIINKPKNLFLNISQKLVLKNN